MENHRHDGIDAAAVQVVATDAPKSGDLPAAASAAAAVDPSSPSASKEGEREPIKRKLELIDSDSSPQQLQQNVEISGVGCEGLQTSLGVSVNDSSPPPMKRNKTETGDDGQDESQTTPSIYNEVDGEDTAATPSSASVSRQCPKCMTILTFRSERAATGGLKMHIGRCFKSRAKESSPSADANLKQENDVACESKQAKDSNNNADSGNSVYSLIKNLSICNKDYNTLQKRKLLIKPPDHVSVLRFLW